MDLRTFIEAATDLAGSLTPSLVGSAVAQAWKPGLPWRQRFMQWVVGSTVSYYATLAIIEVTGWAGFLAQSIAFGIALLAFDATPRVLKSVSDVLATVPGRIGDTFLPKKKD